MPPYGYQPQTLAYRVEIEQSSLSEVVQQIQASVGQAMSTALATVQGFATQGHATTAVAMGTAGGNLAFMEQQRSRLLTQPTAAGTTGPGVGAVVQAVAAKAGLVDPGFSQTASGLGAAATATLREVKALVPEALSKVGNFTAGVLDWASMIGIIPGLQPLGLALGAAGGAIHLATAGLDRFNDQESVKRMLARYGDRNAAAITEELDRATRSMKNIGFDEAAMVARSAILNYGPENLNAATAREAVMSALQDWRVAGKVMGVSKEEALDLTGSLYRMGIRPGEGIQNLFGQTATAAHALGVSTTALSNAGMQAAQMSMPLGYDALASQNQFMIQTATLAEAMRGGTITAGQRAMMAGFVGPQADQATAAATQYMASMRVLAGTGFGRIAGMGMERGGTAGGIGALAGAAAGASMEQILTYDVRSRRQMTQTTQDALEQTLGTSIENQIRAFGMNVNHDTLVSMAMQLHPDVFQTQGAAETFALNWQNPWIRERGRVARLNTMEESRAELDRPASGLARAWDTYMARTGAGWRYIWSGETSQEWSNRFGSTDPWAMNEDEVSPYRGVRGLGRQTARIARSGVLGGLWRTVWSRWGTEGAKDGDWFRSYGGVEGMGTARAQFLRQSDVARMSGAELMDGRDAAVIAMEVKEEAAGYVKDGDERGAFRYAREKLTSEAWDVADTTLRQDLSDMRNRVLDRTGGAIDLSQQDAISILGNQFTLRKDLRGLTGKAREERIAREVEVMRGRAGFGDYTTEQLKTVVEQSLRFDTDTLYTDAQALRGERLESAEARRTSFRTALTDDEAWGRFSSRVLKKDSAIAREIHAKRGTLDEAGVRHLLAQAVIKGEINEAWAAKLGKDKAYSVEAMRELMMAGSVGETKGTELGDLPKTGGQAQAESIDELVKRMGSLTDAINNYMTAQGMRK